MRRTLAAILSPAAVLAIAVAALTSSPAMAQSSITASVTHVVDGDTVDAQRPDGSVVRVRLIGIDTPERGQCGYAEASNHMEDIALGRTVALVADSTQDATDRYGRTLAYLDRDDGLDLGLDMIRAGWSDVYVYSTQFQRFPAYSNAAFDAGGGAWRVCGGDFHLDEAELLRSDAEAFMDDYYARVSNRRFNAAWSMLGRPVRRSFGSFRTWRAGHRRSLGVSLVSLSARLSGGRAVVSVRLRSRDRDACSGRIVRQRFAGRWVLVPRQGDWVAVKARIHKTGGGNPQLSKSECATKRRPRPPIRPQPPPPPPQRNCDPSYPGVCIPPYPPDLDCDDVPYSDFTVIGRDPHGFDGDGDGRGCEE